LIPFDPVGWSCQCLIRRTQPCHARRQTSCRSLGITWLKRFSSCRPTPEHSSQAAKARPGHQTVRISDAQGKLEGIVQLNQPGYSFILTQTLQNRKALRQHSDIFWSYLIMLRMQ
jgi:hypothetical protein